MTPSSAEKFGGNRTTLDDPVPPMRFAFRDKNDIVREEPTLGEIFMQIGVFGLPMMLGYLMVWNVFTALPNAELRALTAERPPPNEKPFRNLRGEVRERHGKVVTQRKRRRVRRSL